MLAFTSIYAHSQLIFSVKHYQAPIMYAKIVVQGKPTYNRPWGKNVFVDYDTLFKSYQLLYMNEEGEVEKLRFKYITTEKERIYNSIPDLVREEQTTGDIGLWYVFNTLSIDGRLSFLNYASTIADGEKWIIVDNNTLIQ